MQIEVSTKGIYYMPTVRGNVVRDRLPGMNDIIDVAKAGCGKRQPYAEMKTYFQMFLYSYFNKLPGFNKVKICIDWYEPNSRRDIDNIAAGAKFVLDALVKASVIVDDSQKYVKGLANGFYVDKEDPRIVLNIEEVGA